LGAWDSLATLNLLDAVHEEFGVQLSLATAARITSIADLRAALAAKGNVDV
jgi:acyl carrier protein